MQRRKRGVKKETILMAVLALFIATSVEVFAKEKAEPETTKQSSPSSSPFYSAEYRIGGIIMDIDLAAGKITIRQKKVKGERTVTLNLDKEGTEKIYAFHKGDAVNVWVKGNIITEIQKIPEPIFEEIRK